METALAIATGILGGILAILFVSLILCFAYAAWYGNSLHGPHDGWLIHAVGFKVHSLFMSVVTRVLITFRGVTFAMDGEAKHRAKEQERDRAEADKADPEKAEGPICFYGDSEFSCWHNLRTDMQNWSTDCLNAGFGGSRSCDLIRHADKLCFKWRPRMVVLHACGNDWDFRSRVLDSERRRKKLLSRVCENMVKLVRESLAQPSVHKVLLLFTARRSTYCDAKWQYMCEYASRMREALLDFGGAAECVDLREVPHDVSVHYRADRVHLNVEGHAHKATILREMLRKLQTDAADADAAEADAAERVAQHVADAKRASAKLAETKLGDKSADKLGDAESLGGTELIDEECSDSTAATPGATPNARAKHDAAVDASNDVLDLNAADSA